jgi:predicted amidohydrolase
LDSEPLDLVVCPELFASGYNMGKRLRALAEPSDGPFAGWVAGLAQATGTAIVYGYPERDGDRLYNAAACFDVRGRRVSDHRKLLLPPGFETEVFSPGDGGVTVFDLGGVRCSILICYEVEFPEAVRAVAQAGAEIVAVPTALGAQWHDVAHRLIPTRAFENGVWLLYSNHAGEENGMRYLGGSCIVAPDGRDVARAGAGETLLPASIELDAVRAARRRLPYLDDVLRLRGRLES